MLNARNINVFFAIAFIVSGLLGFIPNPIVSSDGLFAVNIWHNLVHLLTGSVFAVGAFLDDSRGLLVVRGVGVFYIIVTILGFVTSGGMLLGFIHINHADRWLHLFLAVVIVTAGFVLLGNRQIELATE
jgi:hypothetical protein